MRHVCTDIMGMPIIVEIPHGSQADITAVFDHFIDIDRRFSTYKNDSEISRINRGDTAEISPHMQEILALAEQTRQQTGGFFDVRRPDGLVDPSGVVKGWAIRGAAQLLLGRGISDFYIDAGGDIQTGGRNAEGGEWRIGVRSPFNREVIVKVIEPCGAGVATSGTAVRGAHIYNPHQPEQELADILSITVVGPDILEADRFATAAFAMGQGGIQFIETMPGLEAYHINSRGIATMTSGFSRYAI